jgi:V/A-type H+/Na+-transporting ATPase subunit I
MALAKMTKISILAPRDIQEVLVNRLHQLEAVHITDLSSVTRDDEELKGLLDPPDLDTRMLRLNIAKTEFLLEVLESVEKSKSGLISSFLKEKVHVTYEEFMAIGNQMDLDEIYREMEELDARRRHAEGNISEWEEDLAALGPWKDLDCPLGEDREIKSVELRLVIIPSGNLLSWVEEMEDVCPHAYFEETNRVGESIFVSVLVHKQSLEEFENLASKYNLEQAQFAGRTGTVREEIDLLERELTSEKDRKDDIDEDIRKKLHLKPAIYTLNDYLHNQLNKEEVKERFLHTESAVAVEGWIEESRADEVDEGLKVLGMNLDISFDDPGENEAPPSVLVNRRRVRPAENLINLFGIPNQGETDPTPYVNPFFILFFGMCIGDVGYGLILAAVFWLAMKKLDVSETAKSFFRLFMYCGFASIAVGIFTRGYFGIDQAVLPGFLKFPGSLDILKEPIPLMIICAALGLIHISVGVAIEMYDNMRVNSFWLGFCEQGTTLLLWLGIAVLALGAGIKVPSIKTLGLYIMLVGAAGIVFLSNISSKSMAGKFFGGFFNLYGLFGGTIGDVASYLRLYALGMATVAIGYVVNLMAGMVWGTPVLGIVLVLLVLVGGHLFNLLISFLGAFVHPLRLQYVEFFGKFYDDGGEIFAPLKLETYKTMIDEQ